MHLWHSSIEVLHLVSLNIHAFKLGFAIIHTNQPVLLTSHNTFSLTFFFESGTPKIPARIIFWPMS